MGAASAYQPAQGVETVRGQAHLVLGASGSPPCTLRWLSLFPRATCATR